MEECRTTFVRADYWIEQHRVYESVEEVNKTCAENNYKMEHPNWKPASVFPMVVDPRTADLNEDF